jgi:hypothetical protein
MHNIISLSLYLKYGPIYRQRDRCQSELGFLLLDLGVLSEFYLDFDPLIDTGSDPRRSGIRFELGVLSQFYRE